MAGPKETIWEAEPHTIAKHIILKTYLEAWFPILSRWSGRVVYYDGFAGPGVYSGGEKGSPLIALDVAREHRASLDSELVFVFVEERDDRATHLERTIRELSLPPNFRWRVRNDSFAEALGSTLDFLELKDREIAPTFAFIDPFGITGLPFCLVERLLSRRRCEALITFMSSTIRRFVTELPDHVNDLIGNPRAAEEIAASSDRVLTARKLYEESLRSVVRFVRFFEMRDANQEPIYQLFFASNHRLGHSRMKESMWKVDSSGDYSFCDGVNPDQMVLFSPNPGSDLVPILWKRFHGQTVDTEEVLLYTEDHTPFLDRHTRAAMKLMESEGGYEGRRIAVAERKLNDSKRRKGTYPKGTLVTFLEH